MNIGDKVAGDISDEFKNRPAMFGELVNDQNMKDEVSKLFGSQDKVNILKDRYEEYMYSYRYNQAVESLFEFVQKHPDSSGGILSEKDTRGVRHTVYVK